MSLKILNSLSKQKELFQPLLPGTVRMYVCGPTVYDEPHIGHLRSAYNFEIIRSWLEYTGHKVKFVRNVTDVDDKIIDKARSQGETDLLQATRNVSEKYFQAYKRDLGLLGIREPSVEPRATLHIQEMISIIQALVEQGKAYASEGDVYFSVTDFPNYGKLSHQNTDAILQNVRIDKNEKKRHPLDFALWKSSKPDEPNWSSPWGNGRPGWHIECSAMSMKYLGETFDIHGGGRDLIFPHHENEIAQSEACSNKPLAKYWIHHGLITVNDQKMSKSLKNYITLEEATGGRYVDTECLKFLFLGTHYTAPLDYSSEKMAMEKSIRSRFLNFMMEAEGFKGWGGTQPADLVKSEGELKVFEEKFTAAMNDDFNTPLAIATLHELVNHVRKTDVISLRTAGSKMVKKLLVIFGLSFKDSESMADQSHLKRVQELVEERDRAKTNKDFTLADRIRQEILEKYHLRLVDEKDGKTHWVHKDL